MHLTVRHTLARARTHKRTHQTNTRMSRNCTRTLNVIETLTFILLCYHQVLKDIFAQSARVGTPRALTFPQITAYSTAEPPTLSSLPPLALLSLSLLRLPHCFFSLSPPFSLFLSPSLIDSPFPSAALLPLVMRIVSDIFRWMEPLVDSEGMGYTAGTVFLFFKNK